MSWVARAGLVAALAAACGGLWSPGHRQIATGGPLVLELDGPMAGTLVLGPTPAWSLDAARGKAEASPPVLPEGAWIVERTAATPAEREGTWALRGAGPQPLALEWTGPCGVPVADRALGLDVRATPDEAGGATVSVVVPLSDTGLATFRGHAPLEPLLASDLRATGTWELASCRLGDPPGPVGEGKVRIRWNGDPATLRAWPAPLPWEG